MTCYEGRWSPLFFHSEFLSSDTSHHIITHHTSSNFVFLADLGLRTWLQFSLEIDQKLPISCQSFLLRFDANSLAKSWKETSFGDIQSFDLRKISRSSQVNRSLELWCQTFKRTRGELSKRPTFSQSNRAFSFLPEKRDCRGVQEERHQDWSLLTFRKRCSYWSTRASRDRKGEFGRRKKAEGCWILGLSTDPVTVLFSF